MKISYRGRSGFTLIELLVVISIIGLLSSVVLASLQSARDKGVIGAGQTFDAHTYQAFGADAALIVDFENSLKDISGNSNTFGYVFGTSYSWVAGQNSGSTAFYLNSSGSTGAYVSAPLKGFPNTSNNNGNYSISLWIKPDASVTTGGLHTLVAWGDSGNGTRAVLSLDGNRSGNVAFSQWFNDLPSSKASIKAGVWQHIALSFSNGSASIYINGRLVDTLSMLFNGYGSTGAPVVTLNTLATIGYDSANGGEGRGYVGAMDSLRIYGRSLQIGEIQKLYAEGLKDHPNLAQK